MKLKGTLTNCPLPIAHCPLPIAHCPLPIAYLTFVVLVMAFLAGCYTASKVSNQNLSYIYWKESSILHPEFKVYHENDSISRLFCHINPRELLFSREGEQSGFSANYSLSYKLFPSYESKELLDSGTFNYLILKLNGDTEIYNSFPFHTLYPRTYLLEVMINDLKRKQSAKSFIDVDKRTLYNNQNYLANYKGDGKTVFKSYLTSNEVIVVQPNLASGETNALFLKYYIDDFPVAAPPFSVRESYSFNSRTDSTARLLIDSSHKIEITFRKNGLYRLQSDTLSMEGLTFLRYDDDFPRMTNAEKLIAPLRYITTKQEYSELLMLENKKTALDNFWLNITGNPDRGKKVIKQFYMRVQDANKYFSSYLEGWKSDRGMIFIIYGPPDIVYKNTFSENWVYGEEGNLLSVNFSFVKVDNPFSDNDFELNRSAIYKNSWYLAVDTWRQGVVY